MSVESSAKLKVIPFLNYIKIMMLCGLVRRDMKSILLSMNFNILPESRWKQLENDFLEDERIKSIVNKNRRRRLEKKSTLIPDDILEMFNA